jgi:hypothetical protein
MIRKLGSGEAEARCEKRGLQHGGGGAYWILKCSGFTLLLLCFSGCAQAPPKSSASGFYELTVQAVQGWRGDDPKDGLQIHSFVKSGIPFSLVAKDRPGDQLRVSGTVKEKGPGDFCIEKIKVEAYASMFSADSVCDSKETMDMRKAIQAYNVLEPPEGYFGYRSFPGGSGLSITLKRKQSPDASTTAPSAYWLNR